MDSFYIFLVTAALIASLSEATRCYICEDVVVDAGSEGINDLLQAFMPDLQTNTACRNNPGSSVVQQECPLGCLEVHVVAVLDVPDVPIEGITMDMVMRSCSDEAGLNSCTNNLHTILGGEDLSAEGIVPRTASACGCNTQDLCNGDSVASINEQSGVDSVHSLTMMVLSMAITVLLHPYV